MNRLSAYQVYLLTRFVQALSFAAIGAYTALYRINIVGLNPLQLILVGTVLEITSFLFEVPTGVIADAYSRKLSTVIGVVLVGVGFMFESLFPTFVTVLIAQVIWGIGFTFISGAREAWIAGEVGEKEANKAYFKAAQLVQIGSIFGIILSMFLAVISVRLPIFVGGLLHVMWGVVLFFLMPEKHFTSAKSQDRSNWQHMWDTLKSGITQIKYNRMLLLIVAGGGIYGMFSEGFDRLWTAHLIKNYVFPAILPISQSTWFGIIYLVTLTFSYIGIGLVNKGVNKESERSIIITFIGILGSLMGVTVGFAFAPGFTIAVAFTWIIFMLREATYPLYNSVLIKESVQSSRATVLSIASQANSLGQITGGPILGVIATFLSLRMGMFSTGIALVPVIFLFLFALKNNSHARIN